MYEDVQPKVMKWKGMRHTAQLNEHINSQLKCFISQITKWNTVDRPKGYTFRCPAPKALLRFKAMESTSYW